jgi:hypothetical protein
VGKIYLVKSPALLAISLENIISNNPALATNMYTGLGWGDINQDGERMLSPRLVGITLKIQLNWTGFSIRQILEDCSQMYVIDLDGDGDADVISASAHNYGIWWHEQVNAGGNISLSIMK